WPGQGPYSGSSTTDYTAGQEDLWRNYLAYTFPTFRMYTRNSSSVSYDPRITDTGLSKGPGASNKLYIDRTTSFPYYYSGYVNDSDVGGTDAAWAYTSSRRVIHRNDSNGATEGGVALINMFYFQDCEATSTLSGVPLGGSIPASQVIMLQNMLNYMDPLL